MGESFGLLRLVNLLLGSILTRLYEAVGLSPADAAEHVARINGVFVLELIVAALLILFFVAVRASLSVENPGGLQHVAEMLHETIGGLADQVIGHGYQRFQAFVTCVGVFILLNNLIGLLLGLIPGLVTPTSEPEIPLAIAVLTFVYYNFHGVRVNRAGYIKQFLGPLPWLAPLMILIEIISHLARILSLTVRLYANMYASDLLVLVSFSLIPVLIPVGLLVLHAFVSLVQAFVFMLLAMIYLSMAVAHEH